jgi:hypothetical protein
LCLYYHLCTHFYQNGYRRTFHVTHPLPPPTQGFKNPSWSSTTISVLFILDGVIPMAAGFLKAISQENFGTVVPLSKDKIFRIGRLKTCDLQIETGAVSRNHAEIILKEGSWIIQDLKTANGTRVNGNKVNQHTFQEGDVLSIGKHEYRFTFDPDKPDTSPPPTPAPKAAPAPKATPAPKAAPAPKVEDFKAKTQKENSGGTAFVDMESMFGSEGGTAGTMNIDMDEFLGEDPEAGKKALQKILLTLGICGFFALIIIAIAVIKKPTTETVPEVDMTVGEQKELTVKNYGKIEYTDNVTITEETLEEGRLLGITAVNIGEARIKLQDYYGNFIEYQFNILEKETDYILIDVINKYGGKPEDAKVKLAQEWLDEGDFILKKVDIEPSAHFNSYVKYYSAEILLRELPSPPSIYRVAKEKRTKELAVLDEIFKLYQRKFQQAIARKNKKEAEELISFLDRAYPDPQFFHPETWINYRRIFTWMKDRLKTTRM